MRRAAVRRESTVARRLRDGVARARRSRRPLAMARGFVTGYRNAPIRAAAQFDTRTLHNLVEERRYDEAVTLAAALLVEHTADRSFLSAARTAFARAGEITLQADAVQLLRSLQDSPGLTKQQEMLAGRLRETDPAWRPGATHLVDLAPAATPSDVRVLHVLKSSVPYRQSGYTMRSRYIIDSQRAAGLDPVVVTFPGFPEQLGITDAPRSEVISDTRYHRLAAPEFAPPDGPADAYLDAFVAAAAPLVRQLEPAVLHAHSGNRGYEGALVTLALGRAFDLPVVYEVRGFFESLWTADVEWNERGEIYARRFATETRCMAEADAVVTLSESMKADIVARGVSAQKVLVVPNGVDVEAFRPGSRRADLASSLGVADSFVFGYVSNLDHFREGHEILILAAAELRRRGVRATALIVGDGTRRAELHDLAISSGAAEAVVFTGRVPHDEVLDHYHLLDVFVVPRVDERAARLVTPLKPFEAMAAGVPVVISDLPALQEIIGDGSRGRSFPAGDASALADVLEQLAGDPDRRQMMSHRAREWVVAERQWSSNAARYVNLYRSLTAGNVQR